MPHEMTFFACYNSGVKMKLFEEQRPLMRIEIKEKGTPEFYKEVVCVMAQYMLISKNPERKIKDSFNASPKKSPSSCEV